jgi:putative glutamine amidotransferase
MSRPIVGITCYAEESVRWGVWNLPAALVPLSYVRAVERAGARALLLPPSDDGVVETLDVLDGLLLTGGADLDPALYDQEPHPATLGIRSDRDSGELALVERALERDMPVLGVCRGSQVLNIAYGGDLVQHLPEVVGHERHRFDPGVFGDHDVRLEAGSTVGSLLGERSTIKSHHHQGFGRVGEGLRVVGWADDGTPEAVEDPERRFAVGVLWHPEAGEDPALFEGLGSAAAEYRRAAR